MPELRKDPILNRWIIIAEERSKRPTDFIVDQSETKGGFCPLCAGNELTTPNEVLVYGRQSGIHDNSSEWSLRVVPNKYPALVIEGELDKRGEGLYDRMNGIGAHEVIIESPHHEDIFTYLPHEQMKLTFRAFRDRIYDLGKDPRFQYVMIFKNFGRAAGASLEHTHSQLVALPILPRMITSELAGTLSYYNYKNRCIFCDIIRQEIQQDVRVLCSNDDFITLMPFAPRTPFEMWIIPRKHNSSYMDIDDHALARLTDIFSETLRRLDTCIPGVPYNFVLHTQPLRSEPLNHYHWHFEIVPKLTSIAGFEWGTGFYINPIPPEESCKYLQEVKI